MISKTSSIVSWSIQILLTVGVGLSGFFKMTTPYADLAKEMAWVHDFSPTVIYVIGFIEMHGAMFLIAPYLVRKSKILSKMMPIKFVPIGAVLIGVMMIGAVCTHINRGEYSMGVIPFVLLIMAIFVFYIRRGLLKSSDQISK
jgi:hypothetical protein